MPTRCIALGIVLLVAGCSLDRTGIGAADGSGPGPDAGDLDAGAVDAGELDGGELDAGAVDAGELDGGELDAGELDAGGLDAGPDGGGPDAGQDGGQDAGQDGGTDAGQDAGPPLDPCDTVVRDSRTYLFCSTPRTHADARARCMAESMDMVVIGSDAENGQLEDEVNGRDAGGWLIGLDDRAEERTFRWVDGTSPGYTRWGALQPDDWFGEDCVEIQENGRWNDFDCGDARPFICEAP